MWISPEDGSGVPEASVPEVAVQSASEIARAARLKDQITLAMVGGLPRGRPLKPWEPLKLAPQHLNWIFDRSAGMRESEIAERYSVNPQWVCTVLGHPDAESLMGELMSVGADRIADPMARIQAFSHEMINTKLEIVRDVNTEKKLRNDIAGDFLDRAGYGAQHKTDTKIEHSFKVPAAIAARLVAGLDESNRIADMDYSGFIAERTGGRTLQEGESAGLALTPSLGQAEEFDGNAAPGYDALSAARRETDAALADEKEYRDEQRKARRMA
jgi:hypothetical protein